MIKRNLRMPLDIAMTVRFVFSVENYRFLWYSEEGVKIGDYICLTQF